MTHASRALVMAAGLVLSAGCHGARPQKAPAPGPNTVSIAEDKMWLLASKSPLPVYPTASAARGTKGVAVAFLISDTNGKVESVMVLEAPDDPIRDSVRAALTQWQFRGLGLEGAPERMKVQGKVTFYFDIRNGAPLVQGSPQRIQERIAGRALKPKAP